MSIEWVLQVIGPDLLFDADRVIVKKNMSNIRRNTQNPYFQMKLNKTRNL